MERSQAKTAPLTVVDALKLSVVPNSLLALQPRHGGINALAALR